MKRIRDISVTHIDSNLPDRKGFLNLIRLMVGDRIIRLFNVNGGDFL